MKFDAKKLYIDNQKIKLELLIKELEIQLPININTTIEILNNHYKFINFVKYIKIFEDYKWQIIKENYNILKKEINIDKNKYKKIIKIYGIINCYYSLDIINNNNNIIKSLYDKLCILNIEFCKLQELHNILINKRKNYIRNIKIIKIYKSNNDIIILINKLQEIYNKLKDLKII